MSVISRARRRASLLMSPAYSRAESLDPGERGAELVADDGDEFTAQLAQLLDLAIGLARGAVRLLEDAPEPEEKAKADREHDRRFDQDPSRGGLEFGKGRECLGRADVRGSIDLGAHRVEGRFRVDELEAPSLGWVADHDRVEESRRCCDVPVVDRHDPFGELGVSFASVDLDRIDGVDQRIRRLA